METIDIRCPKCGKILRLQNVPDIEAKIIPCPVCGQKTPFSACERVEKKTACSDTCLPGNATAGKVFIVEKDNRNSYELQTGLNSIGRAAATSTADIKINTPDKGMSRVHAVIEVLETPKGNTRCTITNAKNKNSTFVNGHKLGDDDSFHLKDGDSVTMSQSEFYIEFR